MLSRIKIDADNDEQLLLRETFLRIYIEKELDKLDKNASLEDKQAIINKVKDTLVKIVQREKELAAWLDETLQKMSHEINPQTKNVGITIFFAHTTPENAASAATSKDKASAAAPKPGRGDNH